MDTTVQILIATVTPPAINSSQAITANFPGHNRDQTLVLGSWDEVPKPPCAGTRSPEHPLQAKRPLI